MDPGLRRDDELRKETRDARQVKKYMATKSTKDTKREM
jgi:hypothetical protein